ncbi:MAG TPA: ATP-dependent DNA helicase UvrD2 [Acidimicrobiia bacterium]|nr:ATP-dependent DNA helicase UvrD2 [Acidimicrobiia bacterium]
MAVEIPFPGPLALGRGLVVEPGDSLPDEAVEWPVLTVDTGVLADPDDALATLDGWWRRREPSVVRLAVPFADLKAPEATSVPVHTLDPSFEFRRERLHFLVWANRYDGRGGELRWHHAERALTLDAVPGDDAGDVLVDGEPYWVDGGPRGPLPDLAVIHVESVWSGSLNPDRDRPSNAALAPDQAAAVAHESGPARVIAPAGSGKTRVLTERLRHLLDDRGWNPDAVTALAYNRRAAEEMRQRLPDSAANIRTLHAFGYEILGHARGGRPRLLSEREVRRLLDRLAQLKPRANEDVHAPFLEALSEVRAGLWSPEEVEEARDDVPGFTGVFDDYRSALREMGAIDHDEQIYGAVEALLADPSLRSSAQARCRHLLVDEFQDLTPAYLLLIRLLAAPGYDVFGVGDDDQVIYGYAGATPDFLIDYGRFFPGAAEYALEVNYRCPSPIVEAATTLLSHNLRRVGKAITAAAQADTGLATIGVREEEMGERLVETVRSLVAEGGPESVAILARVNVGLLVPQVSLSEAGIPAEAPLDTALLSRSGVRTALAWLRLASATAHGEPMEGNDLTEATRRPARGLSPGVRSALGRGTWTLNRLASFAAGANESRTRDRLEDLVDDITGLAALVRDGETVAEQLLAIRDRLQLGAALDRLDNSRARPTGGHTDDLDGLIMLAHTHPDVGAFEPWLESVLGNQAVAGPRVTLSTVHRVKGLEWPHVVVWDASLGLMPHRLATDVEEERRIFHVAMTRASRSTTVVGREGSLSPFVANLTEPPAPATARPTRTSDAPGIAAEVGMVLRWQGYEAEIVAVEDEAALLRVGAASRMRVRWGETIEAGGRRGRLISPPGPSVDAALLERLKEWRRRRASSDGLPPYVIAHDSHLESIAARRPANLVELERCEGIGKSRLERYGAEILAVMEG